jgi:hypothetical protein
MNNGANYASETGRSFNFMNQLEGVLHSIKSDLKAGTGTCRGRFGECQ